VACEILYSSYANRKLILQFEKEYHSKKIVETSSNWINSYFKQLEIIVDILSQNFNKTFPNKFDGFEKPLLESIKKTPFTSSFYVAFRDGTLIQAQILDGIKNFQKEKAVLLPSYVKYAIRKMVFSENNYSLIETWDYFGEDLEHITNEQLETVEFDPRKRDWYVKAELNGCLTWSDAYTFLTTRMPGLTLSRPLEYGENNITHGIVSVDFTLSNIKELLEKVKASPNSRVYLISTKNEILSSTCEANPPIQVDATNDSKIASLESVMSSNDKVLQTAGKMLFGMNTYHARFFVDGEAYVASTKKLAIQPVSLLIITPQSDFTADFEKVQLNMLYISMAIFLFSFGVMLVFAKRISTPITKLCESAKIIGDMELDKYPNLLKSNIIEIQELANSINSMRLSVSTFAKYAPKDLVKKLIKYNLQPKLGGETKEITMLFSDVEKFSTVAENLPSEYLILHLSEYFDELTKVIMEHNGIIDKYIGDSIMAIWGAPNTDDNQVVNACYAALECQKILDQLKDRWAPLGKPPLPTRIGLHTGFAIVGNIGSQDRMNFTAIGDVVNITSRLEGVNKVYGTRILASENVKNAATGRVLFRVIDKIAVRGRSSGITIFEPLCAMKNIDDVEYYTLIELSAKSKEAFELYQDKRFKKALKLYEEIQISFPNRSCSVLPLVQKCREFVKKSPVNWDGVNYLSEK
jgi:adenylate cyclase